MTYTYIGLMFGAGGFAAWMIGQQLGQQLTRAHRVKVVAAKGGGSFGDSIRKAFFNADLGKKRYKQVRPMNLFFYRTPWIGALMLAIVSIGLGSYYMVSTVFWTVNAHTLFEVFLWDFATISASLGLVLLCSVLSYKLDMRRLPLAYAP
jgi:hypothetical protein